MINYQSIEGRVEELAAEFREGVFEYVVIDNFMDPMSADLVFDEFPDPKLAGLGKSRDYIFAKNKFEKSNLQGAGPNMAKLRNELLSDRFAKFLQAVTGEQVFVDPEFHGGGMHQGGKGSYLNMHADFNFHPLNNQWFRNLNILLYMNPEWKPEYGGRLKLCNKNTGRKAEVDPIFNRCVIMFTRDYTLHGYDEINFPDGKYRRSIAAYAYSDCNDSHREVRSTTWYPEEGSALKKLVGKNWPKLVSLKSKIFGSSTAKNK